MCFSIVRDPPSGERMVDDALRALQIRTNKSAIACIADDPQAAADAVVRMIIGKRDSNKKPIPIVDDVVRMKRRLTSKQIPLTRVSNNAYRRLLYASGREQLRLAPKRKKAFSYRLLIPRASSRSFAVPQVIAHHWDPVSLATSQLGTCELWYNTWGRHPWRKYIYPYAAVFLDRKDGWKPRGIKPDWRKMIPRSLDKRRTLAAQELPHYLSRG